ncbi:M23 family metallopeptidase [Aliterella atlantica]|uniref:M23 family metallopeptidase n=1 Tax=Aliterella atlantica TaxID=1827278 RepID=UPI000698499A|nr:M23 family metallopeptidase [Aliterella atlantica]
MMQQHDSKRTSVSKLGQKYFVLKSLSWISVFSLLIGNQVSAQTESSTDLIVPLPETTQQSAPAPQNSSSNKIQRLQRRLAKPKSNVVRTAPVPVKSTYVPPRRRSVQGQSPVRNQRTATKPKQDYNGAFIDPTDYSVGATRNYEAPSSVVFSDRSTGCSAVIKQGMSPSLCGASPRQNRVVNRSRLANSQPNASWVSRRRSIDKTSVPVQVATNIRSSNTANIRSNRISTSKLHSPLSRQRTFNNAVTLPGFGANSSYYNRTIRPNTQLGNADTSMMYPLTIPATITSIFGWRIHPISGTPRFHAGTDFGADLGTPVVAAYSGNVAIADVMGGYGLTVVLDHQKFGGQTLYGHLSEIFVKPNEVVAQGTVIGLVGSTGNSTGPHLHFEVRQLTNSGWVATDPSLQIEGALAQLVEALRVADANNRSQS